VVYVSKWERPLKKIKRSLRDSRITGTSTISVDDGSTTILSLKKLSRPVSFALSGRCGKSLFLIGKTPL